MVECGKKCEVYSRIVGYFRPVQNWNPGKQEEFKDRLEYSEHKSHASLFSPEKAPSLAKEASCVA